MIQYRLRALDPATGSELWKRDFDEDPPIPFVDPQGERLVLAWKAKSSDAHAAAKGDPRAWEELRKAKLSEEDTVLEVLVARSARTIGSVLIQTGSGPKSFDSAFSEGDFLIAVKSSVRLFVYSLRDGALKAQVVGERAAASAQLGILAVDKGSGHLILYDLNTGEHRQAYHFPEDIAYLHFSGDGKRLLVLIQLQTAYILDVSSITSGHPSLRP